jgi:hypothetical protein
MIALSEEGIVILNFRDPSNQVAHEANCCVQCIPCRDSKGKSEGVVQLHRPFDTEKWEQHICGKRHKENVHCYRAMAAKPQCHKQISMHAFLMVKNPQERISPTHNPPPPHSMKQTVNPDCCGIFNPIEGKY